MCCDTVEPMAFTHPLISRLLIWPLDDENLLASQMIDTPVLKQMTVASLPAIVQYGMASQYSPHEVGDIQRTAVQEKMRMIAHQCPGKNRRVGL